MKLLTIFLMCLSLSAADKRDQRIAELEKQVAELQLKLAGAELRARIDRVVLPYQGAMAQFEPEARRLNAQCGAGKLYDLTALKCVEDPAIAQQTARAEMQKAQAEKAQKLESDCKALGKVPDKDGHGCVAK